MKREVWLDASYKSDEIIAFIPHKKDPNYPTPLIKEDYVWGPGPKGYGYYHLLTRAAYIALHARLSHQSSVGCCCMPQRQELVDLDETKDIVYNRSIASRPDDILAYKEAIALAQGEAQTVYNQTQDLQLVLMLVGTVGTLTSENLEDP